MMTGKRSTHFKINVLPHTTTGIDTNNPMITKEKLPWAPATASTLSMPINASAIIMVLIADQNPSSALIS